MTKKRKKMWGTVQKIIKPISGEPEKAQIKVAEAEELYQEIRVENALIDEKGQRAQLKEGAEVDVVIEADSAATTKKPDL